MKSPVENFIVSTYRKRKQNRKLFNQLDETPHDLTMGNNNQDIQNGTGAEAMVEKTASSYTNHLIPVNANQDDMPTLEKCISDRVRREVDNVVSTVETGGHDAYLAVKGSLAILTEEIAVKSTNAYPSFLFLDTDERDFPGSIEGLHMSASSRLKSDI